VIKKLKGKEHYALDNLRNFTGALVVGNDQFLHHGRIHSHSPRNRHRRIARADYQRQSFGVIAELVISNSIYEQGIGNRIIGGGRALADIWVQRITLHCFGNFEVFQQFTK
jgi:hypothetical protein